MAETGCRFFNGYKPCGKSSVCERSCTHFESVGDRILIVHLEALGAVLRSTSLLPGIRRAHPKAHITWVTKSPAHHLLLNLPEIDRVLTIGSEDLLKLSCLEFDIAFVIDKSLTATGVLKNTRVSSVRGFRADGTGVIVPANPEAEELWELGLSNHRKFFENKKTEQQLVFESLGLKDFARDEYLIQLSDAENAIALERRQRWSPKGLPILGLNTGCSPTLPHKKLSVENHRELITRLRKSPLKSLPIVLLGGPEDSDRNRAIAEGMNVILSPTMQGLRDGLASVQACDLIVTGDSLGMHMAIGLKKWVVAWFGPSCPQEIDLYGRGAKILTQAACSPCWKRDCHQTKMCYDQVDLNQVIAAIEQGKSWLTLSSKPHFQETLFLASPC